MHFQCPRCKDVRELPGLKPDAEVKCGECLMNHCEVVQLIPVEPRDIGHPGRVAFFPIKVTP